MAEFKGTRGPWKMAGLSSSGKDHFKVIGTHLGSKYKVANVPFINGKSVNDYTQTADCIEAEANAKLIAAAPDLLETLAYSYERQYIG